MYPARKSYAISETKARELVGDKAVNDVMSINCDFTGRTIDDCYGVTEMSALIETVDKDGNDVILTVLYLIDTSDLTNDLDDLGNLDYSDYTFTVR